MLGLMSRGAPSCLLIGGRTLAGLVPRAALMLGDAYGMLWECRRLGLIYAISWYRYITRKRPYNAPRTALTVLSETRKINRFLLVQ